MNDLHPTDTTYVIEVNPRASEGYVRIPVVGWIIEEGRPLPMTLNGKHTLIGGCAVLFPGGMVENPSDGYAFDSIEAWLETNPGKGKAHAPAEKAKTPAQERDEGEMGAYDIEWTEDTFKNNSFWHYDDGEFEFVFQIDGGEALPKATKYVVKIKRDEMMALKKNVDLLSVADIMDAKPLEVETEEDDGMDLL